MVGGKKRCWCKENVYTGDTEQLIKYLSKPVLRYVIKESHGCVFIGGIYQLEFYQVSTATQMQTDTFCQDAGGENSPQRGNVNEVRFTPRGGVKVVFQRL